MKTTAKILAVALALVALPGAALADSTTQTFARTPRIAHAGAVAEHLRAPQYDNALSPRFNLIDGQPIR
ncbi:MAG: hypothetical protein WDO13_15875 [Verrucomicrobiota bacterium]